MATDQPVNIVYRSNNLFDTTVPMITEAFASKGIESIVHAFPAGTPEPEMRTFWQSQSESPSKYIVDATNARAADGVHTVQKNTIDDLTLRASSRAARILADAPMERTRNDTEGTKQLIQLLPPVGRIYLSSEMMGDHLPDYSQLANIEQGSDRGGSVEYQRAAAQIAADIFEEAGIPTVVLSPVEFTFAKREYTRRGTVAGETVAGKVLFVQDRHISEPTAALPGTAQAFQLSWPMENMIPGALKVGLITNLDEGEFKESYRTEVSNSVADLLR